MYGYKNSNYDAEKEMVRKMSGWVPKFTDIFDEESFYIFVMIFVPCVFLVAYILSKYVDIKDSGHLD